MTGRASLVAAGAAALVVGGVFAGIGLSGGKPAKPVRAQRAHVREAPMGPVHGLMLVLFAGWGV